MRIEKITTNLTTFELSRLVPVVVTIIGKQIGSDNAIKNADIQSEIFNRALYERDSRELGRRRTLHLKRNQMDDIIIHITVTNRGFTREQVETTTRKREIVQTRQECMYFLSKFTKLSLSQIGANIGGKDHATVLHAKKTIQNVIDTDNEFRKINKIIELKIRTALGLIDEIKKFALILSDGSIEIVNAANSLAAVAYYLELAGDKKEVSHVIDIDKIENLLNVIYENDEFY
jgi:hypothetical protein